VPASVSILRNVETAVGRRRADGSGFHPEEAIDLYSAFSLFTTGSSYGAFSEQTTGRIRAGMHADFTVLSDDPFAPGAPRTGNIAVKATYISGSLVWSARE
jgi:predicted amidohydrolase YtcJ